MIIIQFLVYCMLVALILAVLLTTKNRWITFAAALYAGFLGWAFHQLVVYFGG